MRFTKAKIQDRAIGHRSPIEALASWYDRHSELFTAPVMMQDHNLAERDSYISTSIYASWIDAINSACEVAREYFKSHDIKICNAARDGKLEVFERANFDSLF
jgi:hypothetical protein